MTASRPHHSPSETRREPIVFLSPMQRVGQTVGHFGTATREAHLPKTWRISLRASYSNRPESHLLSSVAVDLRIGQVVDVPNYVVSATLNLDVFDRFRHY